MIGYPRQALGLVALAIVLLACSEELGPQNASETTAAEVSTTLPGTQPTSPPETDPPETSPPETDPPETSPPETIPVVTSDIVGAASAGNSGGIGEDNTDSYSEAIRNEDGTCSGWAGRDVPEPWTDGLVSGAPFVILARESDDVLGRGTLGTSSFVDVGGDQEQWVCFFPFSATVTGQPAEFRIKVADLDPWVVRSDPTQPGTYVASVNTVASADYFSECTDPDVFEVFEWRAVGRYWSDGIKNLCSNGLKIAKIERPCRGRGEGSDYVTKVTDAADPNVVYEDADGLRVDVATLPPGAPVIVSIATGRPCG